MFWRVAEVQMNAAGGCTPMPASPQGNGLVSEDVIESIR
jgi:hypothetical protein